MSTTVMSCGRFWLVGWIALVLGLATTGAVAGSINVDSHGAAIHGYDTVAYFVDGHPEPGDPRYTFRWKDAEWRFSSAAHRDAFAKAPEKYAPRYGGFCAYAASRGQMADVDPTAWTILGGRLYLNFNQDVQSRWRPYAADYVEDADAEWTELESAKDTGQSPSHTPAAPTSEPK